MAQRFTEQLVVRVTPEMRAGLQADAEPAERTEAQSVRRAIRLYLSPAGQALASKASR